MNKFYLPCDTLILTKEGIVPISELDNSNSIYVINDNNMLESSVHFYRESIKTKNFSTFTDSNYCKINFIGESTYNTCLPLYPVKGNVKLPEEDIPKENLLELSPVKEVGPTTCIHLNGTWYRVPVEVAIYLSLVISTCFKKTDDDMLIPINSEVAKFIYFCFKYINTQYGVYFPYCFETGNYLFTSNLYKSTEELTNIMTKNINLSKSIIDLVVHSNGTSYIYKTFKVGCYKLAVLLQSFFTLNNFETKIAWENKSHLFVITYVSTERATMKHKNKISTQYATKNKVFYNLCLEDTSGKVVIAQNIDKVTTTCIVELNSSLFI